MESVAKYFRRKQESQCVIDISEISWPAEPRVLCLAPHSDDFDAVGVTMRMFHGFGCVINIAVLCLDNGVDAKFEPQTPQAEIRKREQLASLEFFGLPLEVVKFPELVCDETGQLINCPENQSMIDGIVLDSKADIVFLPHGNDTNTAHRFLAEMLQNLSARKPEILAFYNHDPKTITINANAYMPFDENTALWKAELLRHHTSQHTRNLATRGHGFDDRILDDNKKGAKMVECPCGYAEVFEVR